MARSCTAAGAARPPPGGSETATTGLTRDRKEWDEEGVPSSERAVHLKHQRRHQSSGAGSFTGMEHPLLQRRQAGAGIEAAAPSGTTAPTPGRKGSLRKRPVARLGLAQAFPGGGSGRGAPRGRRPFLPAADDAQPRLTRPCGLRGGLLAAWGCGGEAPQTFPQRTWRQVWARGTPVCSREL